MKILVSGLTAACMLTLFAASANAALDDASAQDIAKKAGCTTCHSVDKKGVGPSYKDIAARRKNEADATATVEKTVRAGGKGTYGAIPMPPNPASKISDADLHSLVEWLLAK